MSAEPPETPEAEPSSETIYWLEYNGRVIGLTAGNTVIGRSTGNQLVLDDPLVSRRHAQITVSRHAVVEDLGSVNGVFVNGERINQPRVLSDGDRVTIGKQDLVLRASASRLNRPRRAAETLPGTTARSFATTQQVMDLPQAQADSESEKTVGGDALELLGGVAEKVLALGRGEEAERLLQTCLRSMLNRARTRGGAPDGNIEAAARFAVRLADATGKASWVDYAVELYMRAAKPLPGPVVEDLYNVLRKVAGVDRAGLREYLMVLRKNQSSYGPAERFLVQRIEGLDQFVK